MLLYSEAICASLVQSPPMIGEVPPRLNHHSLIAPDLKEPLNFNQKLGYIYEDAAAVCLEQSPRFEIVARNMQIITPEKQTLGELDFVLHDCTAQKHLHLEVAIKFYLVEPTDTGFSFPGPDKRDNYQRKFERLSSHQMQLSQNPHTRNILLQRYGIDAIESQQLVHGIFYDHHQATASPLPEGANPLVRRRCWMHLNEFLKAFPDLKQCQLVHKALWPCELEEGSALQLSLPSINQEKLVTLASQRCTLVLPTPSSKPMFIAPDDW